MKLLFILLSTFLVHFSYGQNSSAAESDKTYGYTQENPLKMKWGNPGQSYDYFLDFIDRLTTHDGQSLVLLNHFSLRDPDYKRFNPLVRNYQRGMLKKSNYGLSDVLERYQFLTERSKDTITLFVDLNSRGALKTPYGLKLKTS